MTASTTPLDLACPCGRKQGFLSPAEGGNEHAYRAGWRLGRRNQQLCPVCAARYEKLVERAYRRRRRA